MYKIFCTEYRIGRYLGTYGKYLFRQKAGIGDPRCMEGLCTISVGHDRMVTLDLVLGRTNTFRFVTCLILHQPRQ